MSKRTAELMLQMLRQVVDRGTAQRLRTTYKLPNDMAGKTGTTQSHADGWFIGLTPELVAGVWVGNDDPNLHFRTITYGQGAAMALPVWGLFMQQLNQADEFKSISRARFSSIAYPLDELLDCEDYKERRSVSEIFKRILGGKSKTENKDRKTRRRAYR